MDELSSAPAATNTVVEAAIGAVVEQANVIDHEPRTDQVALICRRIPPLWDLNNYVAVNPFLGFASQPISQTATAIQAGLGGQLFPAIGYYRQAWQAGRFRQSDLERAARRHQQATAPLLDILHGAAMPQQAITPTLSMAEQIDHATGSTWNQHLLEHCTTWCAQLIGTDSAPAMRSGELYAAWRLAAADDQALPLLGLSGWHAWISQLPSTPQAAIENLLAQSGIAGEQQAGYLYRLFAGVYGWASLLRQHAWQHGSNEIGLLPDLLAIRISYDLAVVAHAGMPPTQHPATLLIDDPRISQIFQDALEDAYTQRLLGDLVPATPIQHERPALQALFCIDVRSEVLRRHLEAQHPQIETLGFAGFFGVAVEWEGTARCPVLIRPNMSLPEPPFSSHAAASLAKQLQHAPSSFSFVEVAGLGYSWNLLRDSFGWRPAAAQPEHDQPLQLNPQPHGGGMDLEQRVALAQTILTNSSMAQPYARIVLLCGHTSQSENNPHAAGLECGACGGHGGALNARIAAQVLNDPLVRRRVHAVGFDIPEDTWFVAGIHNTTTDQVEILDRQFIPTSHTQDVAQIEGWLAQASQATRQERAHGVGVSARPSLLERLFNQRANDWAEVRPEWGLAKNAAFLAARRSRSAQVDLAGRTFLHEYDWRSDPDQQILRFILSAPVVVASWINLQYFASTVDNQTFGAGTKALHNRIGSHGVVLGNGGDLRTGLPLQSVQAADGSWYHEPLRLQVIIEAPQHAIAAALSDLPEVQQLIDQGWLRLIALDPYGPAAVRWAPGHGWELA
jgi:uncharacterized protein YbcC (UPF0753/DUF2309 family)